MRGVFVRATLGVVGCALALTGCESDESLKVMKRPYLEIQEGDRKLASGEFLRVRAPRQAQSAERSATVTLRNTGESPLEIYSIEVYGAHKDQIKLQADIAPTRGNPVVLPVEKPGIPSQLVKVTLTTASVTHDISAQLKVVTNYDHRGKNVHLVDVVIEAARPMLAAIPNPIDFGLEVKAKEHRTLSARFVNMGSEVLEVTGFQMAGDKGFVVELEGARWGTDSSEIVEGLRLKQKVLLEPGHHLSVPVHYTALHDGPAGAQLTALTNDPAFPNGLTVPVVANGGHGVCPTPKIRVVEGAQVCPQTLLHLSGESSEVATGLDIERYHWRVIAPDGVSASFNSDQDSATPTIWANAAGKYTFQLGLTDSYGTQTGTSECPDAEVVVNVVPCDALHVELIWDQANTSGGSADIDLHMLHPEARGQDIDADGRPDGWFDYIYDVSFENMNPEWDSASIDDNPRLDLDDTDGGGPENINLDKPVQGHIYRIGAHYWEDMGAGATSVTVRVFVRGELVHEAKHESLRRCELWEVAEVDWSNLTVRPVTTSSGDKRIGRRCSEEIELGSSF